ncbi:MAG: hypothetical protein ACTSYF_11710 [Promethearchaeota archaeon]
MRKKGVMGKVLTLIISLILGLAAFALLWMFLTESTQIINVVSHKIIEGFKCGIICRNILGSWGPKLMKGFCGGC